MCLFAVKIFLSNVFLKEEKEGADRGEDASLHCRENNQIVILA